MWSIGRHWREDPFDLEEANISFYATHPDPDPVQNLQSISLPFVARRTSASRALQEPKVRAGTSPNVGSSPEPGLLPGNQLPGLPILESAAQVAEPHGPDSDQAMPRPQSLKAGVQIEGNTSLAAENEVASGKWLHVALVRSPPPEGAAAQDAGIAVQSGDKRISTRPVIGAAVQPPAYDPQRGLVLEGFPVGAVKLNPLSLLLAQSEAAQKEVLPEDQGIVTKQSKAGEVDSPGILRDTEFPALGATQRPAAARGTQQPQRHGIHVSLVSVMHGTWVSYGER